MQIKTEIYPEVGDEIQNKFGRSYGTVRHVNGDVVICKKNSKGACQQTHRLSWRWQNHPNMELIIIKKEYNYEEEC